MGHFPAAVEFIREGISTGGVLVHCAAGISRSSTMAIAYVMMTQKLDFESAFEIVRKARPCISPNSSMYFIFLFHE